jgi:hypothetical protein
MLTLGWIFIGILICGFVACYGFVVGVAIKDLLPRMDFIRRFRQRFERAAAIASTDDSTYGSEIDPTRGRGSDFPFAGR